MKKTATLLISMLITCALLISGAGILFAAQDDQELEEIMEKEMMDIDDERMLLEEDQENIEDLTDPDSPDREFEIPEEDHGQPDERYQDDRK